MSGERLDSPMVGGQREQVCDCGQRFASFDAAREHMTTAHGWPAQSDRELTDASKRFDSRDIRHLSDLEVRE